MKNLTLKTNVHGITLITLVVTVIVLVILGGITFSTLLGEDGLLNLAKNEANDTQKKFTKEKIRLLVAESKKENGKYVAENILTNLSDLNAQVIRGTFPLIVTVDGYTFSIDNNGRVLDADFDYLVEFNGNGVAGTMNLQEFKRDVPQNLYANKYNQDGYTFVSWNTKADGSGRQFLDEEEVSGLTRDNYGVVVLYAQWSQGVARVAGKNYDTLQKAIDVVPTNNVKTTVELLTNTKENIQIETNQNIFLDLKNHTIRIRDYGNAAVVENKGTIEISNGKITSDSTKTATINNQPGGNLTIDGVIVEMKSDAGKQAIYNTKGATLNIKGNTELVSYSSTAAGNNQRPTITNLDGGTLNITGGKIVSKKFHAIENNGTMTIGTKDGMVQRNSPIIQGAIYGIKFSNQTKFNFYDGTIKGKTYLVSDGTEEKIDSCIKEMEADVYLIKTNEAPYKIAYLSGGVDLAIVTFNPNGGEVEEKTRNVEMGKAIGGLPTPTRDPHEFIGWYTEENGGDKINEQTKVASNVTYYAHWNLKFKVNFDANGGSVEETIRYVFSGNAIDELPNPNRDNYYFIGWFTDSNGGVQINKETPINANNITYYAHWLPIFKVNFDANGGSVGETSRNVVSGNTIGELPNPTRDKYDFVGWFTTKTGGVQINKETQINSNNTTYYAQWKKTMYAKIGDQEYETVAKAIDAVPTDGTETKIQITRDTTENFTIKKGQNIVLDIGDNTLNAKSNTAVITNNGRIKITSGTVSSTYTTGSINNNSGATLIIDGARITGKERSAIYNDKGTVIITGDSYIESSATGNAPNGTPRAAVHNLVGGTITITGGTIVSTKESAVANAGTLIVGIKKEEDGNINITTPVLIGKTYGIINKKTFEFYDGIAKGIKGGISGTITKQEPNTQIANGTEEIDGQTYKTQYLQ